LSGRIFQDHDPLEAFFSLSALLVASMTLSNISWSLDPLASLLGQ
jgi:hypothetical protein